MADANRASRLPPLQISQERLQEYRDFYLELLGFVPPRVEARTDVMARLDPEMLAVQEELRRRCMYPDCFDVKTSQLILFAILLVNLQDAAKIHALAAYRAGATFEELIAVVNLTFLFKGLSAANLGAQIIQGLAEEPPGA